MRRGMAYNPRYYQLRGFQLERMLEIARGNEAAAPDDHSAGDLRPLAECGGFGGRRSEKLQK